MTPDGKMQNPERAAFYRRIACHSLAPLWEVVHGLVTPTPQTPCVPALWRYDEIRPFLMEAGRMITPIPAYVDDQILTAMSKPILLAYIACCRAADRRGQFKIPSRDIATATGKKDAKKGWQIMQDLLGTGLVKTLYRGEEKIASVYRLADAAEVSREVVVQALRDRAYNAGKRVADLGSNGNEPQETGNR